MTDFHVHIGQWRDGKYFYPQNVFAELKSRGVDEVWFSSTSSCIFCCESPRCPKEEKTSAPTARDLQDAIHEEMRGSVEVAAELGVKANALLWIVPDFFKAICHSEQREGSLRCFANAQHDGRLSLTDLIRQSISSEFSKAPYKGFKLHPFAQEWNLDDDFTFALASSVFEFADKNHLRILIHCGIDESCFPEKFERFIKKSPGATIQLAHSRPAEKIIRMLEKYQNCVCDSAFASEEDLQKIRNAGFAERILYGSDFPVN